MRTKMLLLGLCLIATPAMATGGTWGCAAMGGIGFDHNWSKTSKAEAVKAVLDDCNRSYGHCRITKCSNHAATQDQARAVLPSPYRTKYHK